MVARDEPPPRFCQYCGEDFGEELEPIPSKVAIGGSAIVRAVDGTYKWAEDSSIARAEEHNAPFMKITNMKDHLREGDVAAMPPPANALTSWMDAVKGEHGVSYGFQRGSTGVQNQSVVGQPTKPMNNQFVGPGHAALSAVQGSGGQSHAMRRAAVESVGKTFKPKD